ncbi:MAG: tetratricopeptide repeat protein [Oligoflexia bacterium]|nr:tetratricopeptide repeat protein [Oligoflexia bacterium]
MNVLIFLLLSVGFGCVGRHQGAVQPTPAWETTDGSVDVRIDVADALVRSGSADAGMAMITQLQSQGIRDQRLELIQARALDAIGLRVDAESLLRDIIKRHPRVAAAHDQLGILCLETDRPDEALEHLRRAVRLAPDNADFINNLGFGLLSAGQPQSAIDVLRQALRKDSSNHQIRNNLGFALVAAGRDDEALRVFSADLPPPDARYNLGLGLELRGDEQAALSQYEGVLSNWPSHVPSMQGVKRLADSTSRTNSPDDSPPSNPAP